jgi:hypothetical protein
MIKSKSRAIKERAQQKPLKCDLQLKMKAN